MVSQAPFRLIEERGDRLVRCEIPSRRGEFGAHANLSLGSRQSVFRLSPVIPPSRSVSC